MKIFLTHLTLAAHLLKMAAAYDFVEKWRKIQNYKFSGNSQSSNTTNIAVILSQTPQKSQFLNFFILLSRKIKAFTQSVFDTFYIDLYLFLVTKNIR